MEKENRLDRLFTYVKVSDLLDLAIDGVRHAACQVPEFRNTGNGCIRITMTPLHPAAAVWMGQPYTMLVLRSGFPRFALVAATSLTGKIPRTATPSP